MKNFYITTTLPYVNDIPHIGHTLEFIQADVIVRYMRSKLGSENVWFNVGTDEHGLKILQKAESQGKPVEEFVKFYAERWKEFCEMFHISYDTFYRTSESYHIPDAQEFWKKSLANGDIYKKTYSGQYCVGCEEFKTEKDLVDGVCPLHNKPTVMVSEENYFFKLSKYKSDLLKWLNENPAVVQPASKLNELKNWIENMDDISISRLKKNLPWGIDVPNDPDQVMYVWFDALTNYINVLNNKAGADINHESGIEIWWPGVQIFGPDNLRFQGAIWQGMLLSAGLQNTRKLLCHGMILASDGTKMSKSIGNTVSPFDQFEKYGVEAVRYYLIAGLSTFGDASYKEDDLVKLYNSALANNYGNLLNRVIHLANAKGIKLSDRSNIEAEFVEKVNSFEEKFNTLLEEFELQQAFSIVNDLADFGNKYITEQQPWGKGLEQSRVEIILVNLGCLLEVLIKLYSHLLPESSKTAREMLEQQREGVLFERK